MTESCCCPPEAGNAVCDLPAQNVQHHHRTMNVCPECGETGKPIQGQTIKSLLSMSLRQVQDPPMVNRLLPLDKSASASIKKNQTSKMY